MSYRQRRRSDLALDSDWLLAAGMVSWFLICSMFMAGTVFNILHRNWPVKSVGWYTWIFRGESGWFFLNVKERHVRFLCIVAAVGPASRILLWALKAGIDTQQANAAFLKLIELMFEIGGCSYAIWWFWSKITYV